MLRFWRKTKQMSNLKKLIRERQAKTGEPYQTAHRYVTQAHRRRTGFGSGKGAGQANRWRPPDDRKVHAREDVLRCATAAAHRAIAGLGAIHREEAQISYERAPSAPSAKTPARTVGRDFVTMTAIVVDGAPAWQFSGRIDARWGGPAPKDPAQLARWLKEDLRANGLTVLSFEGNIAEITAHWIAKERTGDEATFAARDSSGDRRRVDPGSEIKPELEPPTAFGPTGSDVDGLGADRTPAAIGVLKSRAALQKAAQTIAPGIAALKKHQPPAAELNSLKLALDAALPKPLTAERNGLSAALASPIPNPLITKLKAARDSLDPIAKLKRSPVFEAVSTIARLREQATLAGLKGREA